MERFPEYTALALGRTVPIPSRNRCYFVRTPDGRRWVLKVPATPGAVLAEAVAHRLGARLGIDQPDAAIFAGDFAALWPTSPNPRPPRVAETGWLSELVSGTTQHLAELPRDGVVNPETIAAAMVLDVVLHNEDRHKGNMLAMRTDDGRLRVVVIDFEDALVGSPEVFAQIGTDVIPRWKWMPMARGDYDALVDDACDRVAGLADERLAADIEAAEHAARVVGAAERLLPALRARLLAARQLVESMRTSTMPEDPS